MFVVLKRVVWAFKMRGPYKAKPRYCGSLLYIQDYFHRNKRPDYEWQVYCSGQSRLPYGNLLAMGTDSNSSCCYTQRGWLVKKFFKVWTVRYKNESCTPMIHFLILRSLYPYQICHNQRFLTKYTGRRLKSNLQQTVF